MRCLREHGYGVLAWDFRAHGASGGDTCSLGYYEQLDAEAALDYALAQPGVKHIGRVGRLDGRGDHDSDGGETP